jgi:hypothetical protein
MCATMAIFQSHSHFDGPVEHAASCMVHTRPHEPRNELCIGRPGPMNLVLKVEGRRDEGTSNDRHGTSWSSVRGFSDWRRADGVFIDRGSKDPHDIVASGGKRLAKLWNENAKSRGRRAAKRAASSVSALDHLFGADSCEVANCDVGYASVRCGESA